MESRVVECEEKPTARITRLILFVSFLACVPVGATAHNALFYPGDAFFSTYMHETMAVDSNGMLSLRYKIPLDEPPIPCGYVGYLNLNVVAIDATLREKLLQARDVAFLEYAENAREYRAGNDKVAGFPMLVYNRDYDLMNVLGLRYNEDWKKLQLEEAERREVLYPGFLDASLVVLDWAMSLEIAGLAIDPGRAPMVDFMGVEKPLSAQASKLKFVILVNGSVRDYARGVEGSVFYVVTDTVTKYVFKDRKLVEVVGDD